LWSGLAVGEEREEEEEEEEIDGDVEGIECERFRLEREEDVVKMIADPKLPSEEEIQRHYVSGHIPYRNWCHVCVKAQGRDTQHRADKGKE
jgi:hypothetical protein